MPVVRFVAQWRTGDALPNPPPEYSNNCEFIYFRWDDAVPPPPTRSKSVTLRVDYGGRCALKDGVLIEFPLDDDPALDPEIKIDILKNPDQTYSVAVTDSSHLIGLRLGTVFQDGWQSRVDIDTTFARRSTDGGSAINQCCRAVVYATARVPMWPGLVKTNEISMEMRCLGLHALPSCNPALLPRDFDPLAAECSAYVRWFDTQYRY
ncbi:uncharacterized protein L969DRAFT_624733 [Mixia osmundae IAM 14324]|uniref:Uncharacterized protein n=1 Tax=Mixia osmundae (strain CBS 9802 / IAM 14324 / JCM 22182 / KY 12970) TaxID=764103 RepID=G7E0Y5_MIXOS|nr:uncharacterized protein L969DRAFT_624733 [Mixia osmundae IAM 14324]KEI38870.1 hypothetical protein L969DRAFT_624733 [Mixia osmundae IAM 14324]GAA96495.1 hypothetical protein E5Q_03163 [Mixia osmundae IAM 14324]